MMLGRISPAEWRGRRRRRSAPPGRIPVSVNLTVLALTTRTKRGEISSPSPRVIVVRLGPRTEVNTSRKISPGKARIDIGQGHDDPLGPAPVVGGRHAEQQPRGQAERRGADADGKRDPRAEEQPDGDVAAHGIGAEQVARPRQRRQMLGIELIRG